MLEGQQRMRRGQRERPRSRETEMQEKQWVRTPTGPTQPRSAAGPSQGAPRGGMLPEPTVYGGCRRRAGCARCLSSDSPSEELSSVK